MFGVLKAPSPKTRDFWLAVVEGGDKKATIRPSSGASGNQKQRISIACMFRGGEPLISPAIGLKRCEKMLFSEERENKDYFFRFAIVLSRDSVFVPSGAGTVQSGSGAGFCSLPDFAGFCSFSENVFIYAPFKKQKKRPCKLRLK